MAGAFITLEGTDSSALSTQLKLLQDDLVARGHSVETIEFPRSGEPSSYFTAQYAQGYYGPIENINSYASSMFYALDHHEAAGQIRTALSRDKVVIASRYTGAVMAQQGAKVTNPEQRKGFYLWLENLEYTLLAVPRPNLSIILRAPSVGSNGGVGEIFDDIAGVFPKDFYQLHTVPVGNQLSGDQINKLILDKITPFLPPMAQEESMGTKLASAGRIEMKLTASGLLRLKLADVIQSTDSESTGIYNPTELSEEVDKTYIGHMDELIRIHGDLREKLTTYLGQHNYESPEEVANSLMKDVLPAAQLGEVVISGSVDELKRIVAELVNDPLPEARGIARQLSEVIAAADTSSITSKPQDANWIASLAGKLVHSTHAESQGESVTILDYSPRNELGLVPSIFFEHSNVSISNLRAVIDNWPYDQKHEVYTEYIKQLRSGNSESAYILRQIRYSFEIVCTLGAYVELRRQNLGRGSWQELTPRYGYDLPSVMDDAGLTDLYERAFDLSLKIHSILQSALGTQGAQYAVLGGHRIRLLLTLTGEDVMKMRRLGDSKEIPENLGRLIDAISGKIAEIHPLIAESED